MAEGKILCLLGFNTPLYNRRKKSYFSPSFPVFTLKKRNNYTSKMPRHKCTYAEMNFFILIITRILSFIISFVSSYFCGRPVIKRPYSVITLSKGLISPSLPSNSLAFDISGITCIT